MTNFIFGVMASVIGGIIVLFLASFSKSWKRFLISLLRRISGADLLYVYNNEEAAQDDVMSQLSGSSEIACFGSRGNILQTKTFEPLLLKRTIDKQFHLKVLLPDTSLPPSIYDWADRREKELIQFDSAFGNDVLKNSINNNAKFLEKHIKSGNVELRRFNLPHMGRILITDEVVFYTPYIPGRHGRDSKVYLFKRNGNMGQNLKRIFDLIWESC